MLSTDDDSYIFPEGSDLVSAVYDISASSPFPAPVTVQIQHCVPLISEDEVLSLGMSFMSASSEGGPPYVFRELNGGEFKCDSSYGEVQLTHFSKFAEIIKWRLGRPIPFFASVYYPQSDKARFVVTQNLAAHITVSVYTLYPHIH